MTAKAGADRDAARKDLEMAAAVADTPQALDYVLRVATVHALLAIAESLSSIDQSLIRLDGTMRTRP